MLHPTGVVSHGYLDVLTGRARYPICDKLMGFASSLVDEGDKIDPKDSSREMKDVLAVILLIVLDLQATPDGQAQKFLDEAQKLASSVNASYKGHQGSNVTFADEFQTFGIAR
jgi:hypothetical protein